MAKMLRIHFDVPVEVAPAPHHNSGSRQTPVGQLGSGRARGAACDPKIVYDEWNMGTDAPWAIACEHCVKTEAWMKAAKEQPNPRAQGRPDAAVDVSEAIARECC